MAEITEVSSVNVVFSVINKPDIIHSKPIFIKLFADGDFVIRQEVREDWMLIDVYRIEDDMLAEHWDAFRPNPGVERIPGF